MDEMIDLTGFVREYDPKKTGKNYRVAIGNYLKEIYPEVSGDMNEISKRYLQEILREKRDFITDLRRIALIFVDRYAPTTAKRYIWTVVFWLEMNDIRPNYRERKLIFSRMPKAVPISFEMELKRRHIQEVYELVPFWCQVIVLMLAGSGMRIGEVMQLHVEDVDFAYEPVKIFVKAKYTKTKTPRMVMITTEAAEALREYVKDRDAAEEIFSYRVDAFEWHWRKAVDYLGYGTKDPMTGYRMFHVHMLRKWFLSRFSLVASREIAEVLAGHSGYLSNSYRRYTHKQIAKEFRKAEKKISVLKGRDDIQETQILIEA